MQLIKSQGLGDSFHHSFRYLATPEDMGVPGMTCSMTAESSKDRRTKHGPMHLLLCLVPGPVNVWPLKLNLCHTHICHPMHLGHLIVRRVIEVVFQGGTELV